jgi:hypothetical protein
MAYESCGCELVTKAVVDEVETRNQMAYEVAEDNWIMRSSKLNKCYTRK